MKRNHIIGHHVTLTIHMVLLYMEFLFFFGDFKNAVFVRSVKMQKKTSVVFFFFYLSSPLAVMFC